MAGEAMVEVRLRHESDAAGKRLCDWPATDLDGLLRLLSHWGVYDGDDVLTDCFAQFRLGPVPHFEITVTERAGS